MSCVVIKLGGEVVQSDALAVVAADIAAMRNAGESVIVVHGGGPQVTHLQKRLGIEPNIVAGRRVTDEATLDVLKMAVGGRVNIDLCRALTAAGAKPVGLNGASSQAIAATKRPPKPLSGAGPEPIDLGHVGDVTGLNGELLSILTNNGYIPVLACIGADEKGNVFNINADAVANRVSVLLGAKSLVLISDVRGVLRDVSDPNSRIASLTQAEAKSAIADGVVTKGMIPKLDESFAALAEGVRQIHIVGHLAPGDLAREVASPGSVGTVLR